MDILNQDNYFACVKLDYSYMTHAISILKVAIVTSRAHDELCLHHSSIDGIVHCYRMDMNELKYPKLHYMRILLFQGHDWAWEHFLLPNQCIDYTSPDQSKYYEQTHLKMSHSSYRISYMACDFMQESTFMHVSTLSFFCRSNIILMHMRKLAFCLAYTQVNDSPHF